MKRYLLLVLILFPFSLHSETKTFICENTYTACEADSRSTSRAIALEKVKRILLEELGAFLQSERTAKKEMNDAYSKLTAQQILSITAGITETKAVDENWNDEKYFIKASISVDPDDVNKRILKIGADQNRLKGFEEDKRKAEEAYVEIERLQKAVAASQSANEKEKLLKEYQTASNTLSALDWFQKAKYHVESGDDREGIDYYTKAIELKQDFYEAYINRGNAKNKLHDLRGAIGDFNKAIELKPESSTPYTNRAGARIALHDYQGALDDCNKVVELKPDWALGYSNRGALKSGLHDYQGALKDCNKAIELDSNAANFYVNRGVAKNRLYDRLGGIADCIKATELKPDYALAYFNLACYYSLDNDLKKSLEYLERSLQLGLDDFQALEKDRDLDNIRSTYAFKELIGKYRKP